MAKRKQTPDVLAEILGGEAPVEAPLELRQPARRKIEPVMVSPPPKAREEKSARWQYRLVTFQEHNGWRLRYEDGRELPDWTAAPLIQEYLEKMGAEGWELAAASAGERLFGIADKHQLYFRKRC